MLTVCLGAFPANCLTRSEALAVAGNFGDAWRKATHSAHVIIADLAPCTFRACCKNRASSCHSQRIVNQGTGSAR